MKNRDDFWQRAVRPKGWGCTCVTRPSVPIDSLSNAGREELGRLIAKNDLDGIRDFMNDSKYALNRKD